MYFHPSAVFAVHTYSAGRLALQAPTGCLQCTESEPPRARCTLCNIQWWWHPPQSRKVSVQLLLCRNLWLAWNQNLQTHLERKGGREKKKKNHVSLHQTFQTCQSAPDFSNCAFYSQAQCCKAPQELCSWQVTVTSAEPSGKEQPGLHLIRTDSPFP